MYCVQCGSDQAEGAKFCHSCGAALTPTGGAGSMTAGPRTARRSQPLIVAASAAVIGVAAVVVLLVLLLEPFGGDGTQTPAGGEVPEATVAPQGNDGNDATQQDGGSSDTSLQAGDTVTTMNPTGDSIRLRVTPSMISVTFATVPNGSSATITGGPATAEGYTWYEIQTSEGTGWTRSTFLQPSSGQGAAVSPATVIPGPTTAPETSEPAGGETILGDLNLNAYCASVGSGGAVLSGPRTGPDAAFNNWHCSDSAELLDIKDACERQYGRADVEARPTDRNDAYTWICFTSP